MKELIAAALIAMGLANVSAPYTMPLKAHEAPRTDFIAIGITDAIPTREDLEARQEAIRAEEEQKAEEAKHFTEEDAVAVAKMLWGEARGCTLEVKQNCVRTVCNRCTDGRYPSTPYKVVTQPSQYYGYSASNPVDSELYNIAVDVLTDWSRMLNGETVEWNTYNSFYGDGISNYFYTN